MQSLLPQETPTGQITAGETTLFAVCMDGEENNQSILFAKAHHAILYSMLKIPYLLPQRSEDGILDEDHVLGQIETLSSNPENPIPNLIYSGNKTYYLYQYYPTENIPFYTNKQLSDAELLTSGISNLATFKYLEELTILFDAAFVALNQEKTLDFNRTMAGMLKGLKLASEGVQLPTSKAIFVGFKFNNPKSVKPITRYSLDWEKIWYRFAIVRAELFKLGTKDNFRYFHDAPEKILRQTKVRLNIYFESLNQGELESNEAIGNTFCLRNIYGFSWENQSCFMDSTLISMFAFNESPFFENLIDRPLPDIFQETICCNDRRIDKALRMRIKSALGLEVNQIVEGKIIVCSELRKALGRLCRRSDEDEDFSSAGPGGQGFDPNDLYGRLMRAMEYNPITYRKISTAAQNPMGAQARETHSFITKAPFLDPLSVYEHKRISYPQSWNTGYEATNSRDSPFISNETKILQADVIVFQLGRGYNEEMENEMSNQPGVDLDQILSTISEAPANTKEEASQNLSNLLDALNSLPSMPTAPHRVARQVYTNRRVEVDRMFNVNGIPYYLRAVVFLPNPGHYAALINCGTSWFEYDDVKLNHRRNLISQNFIPDNQADEIISTKAVMFFYYPDPNTRQQRLEIETRIINNDVQLYGPYQEQVPQLTPEEIEILRRPMTEEEIYQARCQWEVPFRQPVYNPLMMPQQQEDEELQKAIAMSMMQQPEDEDEELRKAMEISLMQPEEEENPMPTLQRPWKQDFLQRWFASKILVIGASYKNEDFQRWVFVDMNYIGVETVNPKARDQVVQFAGDNSNDLFSGVWNEDPVFDQLLELAKMTNKKFDSVWIDTDAWKRLSSYSGMGKKLIDHVSQLLVNPGKDEKGQYIGTFNIPDEQMESIVLEDNTTEEIPLWVYLIRKGSFEQIADETYTEMTDKDEENHLYRLLIPKTLYLK